MELNFPIDKKRVVLALGAESAGNFSFYENKKVYFSKDFGDLLDEKIWENYKKAVLKYLKDNKIKPDVILTDLHPLFKNTLWGAELAQKLGAKHIHVQHHIAHIFSAVGDKIIQNTKYQIPDTIYGVAMDGTGYGEDGKIWGGEIFQVKSSKLKVKSIIRMGHLENQTLIGGELSIKEPARMLISILSKFLDKDEVYKYIKKYYSRNEFELLHNQLQQNFNCQKTFSAGRILDAVSLLLGFCGNERRYKHEPIDLLEKNSTKPYTDLKPKIKKDKDLYILDTTYLFNYVISAIGGSAYGGNYLHTRDKNLSAEEAGRLAATAQLYLAEGIYEILQNIQYTKYQIQNTFFAGGIANNKIISSFLESKGAYTNKKVPRGDAGLSFGQVVYFLLTISKPNITASHRKSSN